jgi:3-methyladenine DNA glycosylase Mpg
MRSKSSSQTKKARRLQEMHSGYASSRARHFFPLTSTRAPQEAAVEAVEICSIEAQSSWSAQKRWTCVKRPMYRNGGAILRYNVHGFGWCTNISSPNLPANLQGQTGVGQVEERMQALFDNLQKRMERRRLLKTLVLNIPGGVSVGLQVCMFVCGCDCSN